MFSNINARLKRLSEMTANDICKLLTWLGKSNLEFDNPNLLVAYATDENGCPIVYTTVEPIFLVDGHSISPEATEPSAYKAGLALDRAIVRSAQERGIGKMFIVLPGYAPQQPDERTLRVIERPVPTATMRDVDPPSQATQYLN